MTNLAMRTNPESRPRRATYSDIPAIVVIHQAAFPSAFLTQLGPAFLKAYYKLVLNFRGGILLVHGGRNQVQGFVAGFLDPRNFYRRMTRAGWRLIGPIFRGLLRRPSLTRRALYNIYRLQRETPEPRRSACELSSIAVRPSASGRGVGQELMKAFLHKAWTLGADCVYLTTDAEDNEAVNRFYRKHGFRIQKTFRQYRKRPMHEYVVTRPPDAPPLGPRGAPWPAMLREVCIRGFELMSSLAGVLLLSPLFAVIAPAILLEDGRPVFFRQIRIGKHGRPFRIWKFRTMGNGMPGSRITSGGDPRVTRIGAWLRRYKLDELPQLLNVIRGEMSLIGPRPEVPEFVDHDCPVWRAVLEVRPGITDAASLIHRNEEALLEASADPEAYYRSTLLPAKLQLNLQHLQSRSLHRDVRLLFLSVRYSFFPDGFDENRVRDRLMSGV